MGEFQFLKAKRENLYLKMLLSGVSGAGKTMSSLLLARGICEAEAGAAVSWSEIAFADCENKSSLYYVNVCRDTLDGPVEFGEFTHIPFDPPFHPDRYLKLLSEVAQAKDDAGKPRFRVLIVDFSQEWEGPGGVLDWNRKLGGRADQWAITGPKHQEVLDSIRRAGIHIIACVREASEIVIERVSDGKGGEKTQVRKVGLKAKQREGAEYEFDVQLSVEHGTSNATVGPGKDRTGLFSARLPRPITVEDGRVLANWARSGAEPVGSRGWVAKRCLELRETQTIEQLGNVFKTTAAQAAGIITEEHRLMIFAAKDAAKLRLTGSDAAATTK